VRVAAFKPVGDDLGRPVEHRQDAAAFRGRTPPGLSISDLEHAVFAELARVRVPADVHGLQVADLVAAQPPAIGHLEQDRVAVGRQPAFAAKRCNPVHLIIGPVNEVLKLLPGERTPSKRRFACLGVDGGVPVNRDLDPMGVPECCSQTLSQP
jgi:hypothetical protein